MPNILTTPRLWRKKALLLKMEATYGADSVPAAANWIEARNIALTGFEGVTAERNIEQPHLGNGGKVIVSIWSKLTFDIAMVGSGTLGTAPKWGPIMRACGFAETIAAGASVEYNLVSQAFESVCAYLNVDGILYKFTGTRGEVKGKLSAKGIPLLSFELTSVYAEPVDAAPPAVTRTGWQIEEAVNSVNTGKVTIDGVDLAFSELSWALGNQITNVDLPGPQLEVSIDGRAPTASLVVLAPTLAVFNPYALAKSNETVPITNTHGAEAGKKIQTDMLARVIGVAEDQVDGKAAYRLSLEPFPDAGNDEIVLTCL